MIVFLKNDSDPEIKLIRSKIGVNKFLLDKYSDFRCENYIGSVALTLDLSR